MNTLQFTHQLPQLMGHTRFIVYFLIVCAEQQGIAPVQHKWLVGHMERTGPNTVTAALDWLEDPERQFILKVKGGWRLNKENAFQLPLSYNLEGKNHSGSDFPENLVYENHSQRDSSAKIVDVVDLSSPVPTITTTTTTLRDENHSQRDSSEWAALKLVLDEYQIVGKKRKDLIACEWVTADYVRAHVEHAKGETANWDNPIGMAITRMLEGMDAPVRNNVGKVYKTVSIDRGKRGIETLSYTFDIDQEAADFTGHEKGCRCIDCIVYRTVGESALCPTCKHHRCECEEVDE